MDVDEGALRGALLPEGRAAGSAAGGRGGPGLPRLGEEVLRKEVQES